MRLNLSLLLVPMLLGIVGCEVINPEETIPTHIQIDSFNFVQEDPSKEGAPTTNISSVWVYYNNAPIGIYDLPCNVPVLTNTTNGIVSVAPGITLNGFSELQPVYPFYKFDTLQLTPQPGKVIQFTPTTGYVPSAVFKYKEDFEVGNSFTEFIPGSTQDTSIVRTGDKDKVLSGGGAGYIYLDKNSPSSESIGSSGFDISRGESYLEINYKCSADFQVGVHCRLNTDVDVYEYFAGVKASPDQWKKIYIELGTFSSRYQGDNYKILLKSALPEGADNAYVLFDNIKVVSF